MTLADLPHGTGCTIARIGAALRDTAYHIVAGIEPGNFVRVLARYPAVRPQFLEVEVANHLVVTLPLRLAREIRMECGCA